MGLSHRFYSQLLQEKKLSGAKSRQGSLGSQGKEGMVQFVTGTYTKVRESHTEWKYEKLIKATRGIERPKDDKLRKEMAKTCWSPRSPRGGATEQIR